MIITISLRQPNQLTSLQEWTFENQPMIRVGRAADNDIVLPNPVISRYHLELCYINSWWEVNSRGSNGSYLGKKLITQAAVKDGMLIRLAISGPQIQINFGVPAERLRPKAALSQSCSLPKRDVVTEIELQPETYPAQLYSSATVSSRLTTLEKRHVPSAGSLVAVRQPPMN